MLPRANAAVLTKKRRTFGIELEAAGRVNDDWGVFAGVALGADAVLVGRPCVWGLTAHGDLGVAPVIRLLRDELVMTMALTGCRTLADISLDHLA
jgi:4-hydroxymandelate oxidase